MPLSRILFDEVVVSLPLFDGLPQETADRLAAAGFGRGLLTATLRCRLRMGGFADMGVLAFVVPVDLMAVRKVKPVRPRAYRASAKPFRLWLRAWVRRAMAFTCSTQPARLYPRFSNPSNSARVSSRTCW